LVFGYNTVVHRGNHVMARAFSFHVVVVAGANEAPVLHHLGEGWLNLPSPLDAIRNSLVESSILAHCGVYAPTMSGAHESGAFIASPRGEAQAAKVVSEKLEVPKANRFVEGKSTTH
jgi:hypothetical protein